MTRAALTLMCLCTAGLAAQVPVPPIAPTPRVSPVWTVPAAPAAPAAPMAPLMPLTIDLPRMDFDFTLPAMNYDIDYLSSVDWTPLNEYVNTMASTWSNFPSEFALSGNSGPIARFQQDPADSLYRQARDELNRGDYRKASALFKSLPQRYPGSAYTSDAQYWQAFALYRIGGTAELQEALAVLEARKPSDQETRRASNNGAMGTQAGIGSGISSGTGFGAGNTRVVTNSYDMVRGPRMQGFGGGSQTDAAALAARIANVLSARGFANDAAVKRALAAAGNNCDQEEQSVRAEALSALIQNDPETGRQMAARILANRDECSVPLRRNAVLLVGNRRDDAATNALIGVLKNDPSHSVRVTALEWLSQSSSDAAIGAVIETARSSDDAELQRVAIMLLARNGSPRARNEVHAVIENNSTSENLRVTALDAMDRDHMTADESSWLRGLYPRTTSPRIRERIIATVGRVGGDANNQWLTSLIRNEDESLEVRATALSRAGRTMDVATLSRLYDSAPRPLRSTIIDLLSERKDSVAFDKLADIARNGTDPSMRREAISALARSKDPRAAQLLLKLVDK